jgi:glycosyltransferase involved in cell wall biosynthesis
MRVAIVAPLWERVPPRGYGAVETHLGSLADGLVERGHSVTLFASGDSITKARLRAVCRRSLNEDLELNTYEQEAYRLLRLVDVRRESHSFDAIASHTRLTLAFLGDGDTPLLHTVHGRLTPDNVRVLRCFPAVPLIAVSNAQRATAPQIKYKGTIYPGVDLRLLPFRARPASPPYLAFLGRLTHSKGAHVAIEVARRAGIPVKLAGRVKPQDRPYFEDRIRPELDGRSVEFLGELGPAGRSELLGGAVATLFPSLLPEPFGLVLAESLACGTPAIALAGGAEREILTPTSGVIAQSVLDMVTAVANVATLDRRACRKRVEHCFAAPRMVDDYEAALRDVVADQRASRPTGERPVFTPA